MALDASAREEAAFDDVVDRLRSHHVYYIGGGSAWHGRVSPYVSPRDAPVEGLVADLAASADPRLRSALIGLLMRHPEYAPAALSVRTTLDEPARCVVETSLLIAAALQAMWAFSLDLYRPGWVRIDADALAECLDIPPPVEDYGRATIKALAARSVSGDTFPYDYAGAWEDVGRHIIADLREEMLHRDTA